MRLIPLFSGSSGNCSLIEMGGVRLLVDAGLPGRVITQALLDVGVTPDTLGGILITHEHSDHTGGVGVLSRRYDLPIFANVGTWDAMQNLIGKISPKNMRVFQTDRDFYIKDLNILPFKTPHDAAESVGFCFSAQGKRVSFLTDVGHVEERLLSAVDGSDLLLIESNHDVDMLSSGPYPYPLKRRILGESGHLSNESCGAALAKLFGRGVRCAILGHLSKENNSEDIAMLTVRDTLREQDIPDDAFSLYIAHRDRTTGIFEVGG